MQVDVRDGLSGRRAAVGDHPKILEPLFLGHLRRHDHQVAEDARVLARRRPEPAQPIPPPRDDEAVGGRGGGDVLEGDRDVVLVDNLARDLAAEDHVEDRRRLRVAHARPEQRVPPPLLVPLVEAALELFDDSHRLGIDLAHVHPPLEQPRAQRAGSGVEWLSGRRRRALGILGQYVQEEDHCWHERRVGKRDVRASEVRPCRVRQALGHLELLQKLVDGGTARDELSKDARRSTVHGALDRADVRVV